MRWNCPLTQDSKFEPRRSEPEHATTRSRRFPTIWNLYEWAGEKHFFFKLEGQSGVRARDLRLFKQAALTTAPVASFKIYTSSGIIRDYSYVDNDVDILWQYCREKQKVSNNFSVGFAEQTRHNSNFHTLSLYVEARNLVEVSTLRQHHCGRQYSRSTKLLKVVSMLV